MGSRRETAVARYATESRTSSGTTVDVETTGGGTDCAVCGGRKPTRAEGTLASNANRLGATETSPHTHLLVKAQ